MTYEIRENAKYNSHEVYFDAIPPFEVRDALKGLNMRWNGKRLAGMDLPASPN